MNRDWKKATKAVALVLAFAVTQVCVASLPVVAASKAGAVTSVTPAQGESGRLTTRGNKSITVAGNSARTGDTVFTGQPMQTPGGVGATVQMAAGRLDISPRTNLTLNFDGDGINVRLLSGCLILTANPGTLGTVEAPGGAVHKTEREPGGRIEICQGETGPPVVGPGTASGAGAGGGAAAGSIGAAPGGVATSGGLFGLGTAGTVGLVSAVGIITAAAVINTPCRRGPNPSPGVPRGRNDECR